MTQPPDFRGIFAQAVAHHQAGRLDDAIFCYRQALALKPDLASAYSNLGSALNEQGKLKEAEESYRQALAVQPTLASAHNNLGTLLWERGDLDEAATCFRRAVSLDPGYFEAHNNLGTVLREKGRSAEAEASIRQALAIAPAFSPALNNLGTLLMEGNRASEAETVYRRLLEISPDNVEGLSGMAQVLAARGDLARALETALQAFQAGETARSRQIFVDIAKQIRWTSDNAPARQAMVRALTVPWARPSDLTSSATDLIKQNAVIGPCVRRAAQTWPGPMLFSAGEITTLASDALVLALLTSTQNTDVELERFLTMARRALLMTAADHGSERGVANGFYAALARQCFINEYVFSAADEERRIASGLRDALAAALETGTSISPMQLLAVASYFPLYSIPGASLLADMAWPDHLTAVIAQQVREPQEETQLRSTIPNLTAIENAVSRAVQTQYEENPYPRWVRVPLMEQAITIDAYLRRKFPSAIFDRRNGDAIADILSAGCGTGQLALEIAQGVAGRVLAIDLSAASLGYAKRKAVELGLTGIEFAQGDLLALHSVGRDFDVVECSGVLHHLADPFAGWRMLLSRLRPGGFMVVGLYSEIARRGVVEARQFIAERSYGTSADDIRRCRQDLLALGQGLRLADTFGDFFGVSSCRDLLFHVQEHRMRLPAIAAFLKESNLTFLGFEVGDATLQAYRRRFPDDPSATDLSGWAAFENDNPDTFSNMYRFWIQKPANS